MRETFVTLLCGLILAIVGGFAQPPANRKVMVIVLCGAVGILIGLLISPLLTTACTSPPIVPTAVPPTAVPPTAVPPTAVPPTAVPPTAVAEQASVPLYKVITSAPYSYEGQGGKVIFSASSQGEYDFSYNLPASSGTGGFQFESKPPTDFSNYKKMQISLLIADPETRLRVTLKSPGRRDDVIINQDSSLAVGVEQIVYIELNELQDVDLTTVSHVIFGVNQDFTVGEHSIHINSINLVQ